MTVSSRSLLGAYVAEHGTVGRLAQGQPLFHEGDDSSHVFACVSGRIRIFVSLPSGQELMLGMKMPGDHFGELTAIDGRPRSAGAVAMVPSSVARLPAHELRAGLEARPDMAMELLRQLAEQLRSANARLGARNAETAFARTGQRLLDLVALLEQHGQSGTRVEVPITQSDLAEWIGATRESTARALAELRRDGIVTTGRGRIVVEDVGALATAVQSA